MWPASLSLSFPLSLSLLFFLDSGVTRQWRLMNRAIVFAPVDLDFFHSLRFLFAHYMVEGKPLISRSDFRTTADVDLTRRFTFVRAPTFRSESNEKYV